MTKVFRANATLPIVIATGGDGSNSSIQATGYNQRGGVGYHGFLQATNTYSSATNPNKYFRINSTGNLQIINSGYTATLFDLTDAGALTVPSTVTASGFAIPGGTSAQYLLANGTTGSVSTYTPPLTFTALSTGFSIAGGTTSKTLTINNTLTLAGTDSTTMTFPATSDTLAGLGTTQTFTAAQTIAPTSTSVVPLTINLPSGSSQNLINLQNQGSTYFSVAAFGYTTIVGGFSSGSSSAVNSTNATTPIFKVKNAASQTADIQQNLNSSNTVLSGTNAAGQIYAGTNAAVVGNTSTNLTSAAYTSATVAVFTYGGTSLIAAGQTVTVAGVTGGTYNGTWQVQSQTTTTFTVYSSTSAFTNVAGTGGTVQISPTLSATANTSATTPVIVKAATSQTANLTEWQSPSGSVLSAIDSSGNFTKGDGAQLIIASQMFS